MPEDFGRAPRSSAVNMLFILYFDYKVSIESSLFEHRTDSLFCLPHTLYFYTILRSFIFLIIGHIIFSRACEVVRGCSVPWDNLSLDPYGRLIFYPKADPLNGEVFCWKDCLI